MGEPQTMIEIVARAICLDRAEPWDDLNDDERKSWTETASAAIEAMREPTEAMVDAHTRRSHSSRKGTGSHLTDQALNAWEAMIDAALSESHTTKDGDNR